MQALSQFLILHSFGWPAETIVGLVTDASLAAVAAANYNATMCGPADIELVRSHGLKALLLGTSTGGPHWVGESASPSDATANKGNAATFGYFVTDEPDNIDTIREATFAQIATKVAALRAADPGHPAYVNMLGGDVASGNLALYMPLVVPDLLSYDSYYWWHAQTPSWFSHLAGFRAASLAAGIPFVVWAEANAADDAEFDSGATPPANNRARLRLSVYCSLAYGAKGIQWFIDSISSDVTAINAELKMLGPTLLGLTSRAVWHTSSVPSAERILPGIWYSTAAANLVIGELTADTDPQAIYLLLANKDATASNSVTLNLSPPVLEVKEISKTTGLPVSCGAVITGGSASVALTIGAGDGCLLRVVVRREAGRGRAARRGLR
jgi:hypothetical protein